VRLAKRAGLLHDLGKAVTHEMEGGHAVIGAQFARKGGEDEMVVNAIAAHHDDEPAKSVLAHLTAAADAISGARPGARREMLESYVRRLEDLEKICAGFKGVEKSFAIQAGREVRVLVEPGEVDDLGALALSREIARKIEDELAYPGQIRVTVVRETRAVDNSRRERASERSSTTTLSEVLAATARAALPCRQATRPTRRLSARHLWSPNLQRPRRLPEARPLAWVAHDTAARRDEAR
jgi:HD superfamily phosphodiesterase